MRRCNRCGGIVVKSSNPEYKYQCFDCDEDLYGIETYDDGEKIFGAQLLLNLLAPYMTKEYERHALSKLDKKIYAAIAKRLLKKGVELPYSVNLTNSEEDDEDVE